AAVRQAAPREAGFERARPGRRLQPRQPDAEHQRREHRHRSRRAARRDAVRRQGELPRRAPLHDARPVGDREREDVRLSLVGVARRPGRAPERQAGGADQGVPQRAGRKGRRVAMKLPIYLDYSATTPVDPRVAQKMIPYLTEIFGNPASRSHAFGWQAEEGVEEARANVAALLNADPKEIVWTSGATEGNNLAIKGAANFYKTKGKHLITQKTEHKAVLDPFRELERQGFEATYLEVEANGLVSLEKLKAAIRPDTILVSIMMVNNEICVIQPVWEIADIYKAKGIIFHCDAVQGAGRVDIDMNKLRADLLTITAHKMYGPKGIGALYVRRKPRVRIEAQIHGGGHERGFRSGTLATHQIVGFGEAARLAKLEMV